MLFKRQLTYTECHTWLQLSYIYYSERKETLFVSLKILAIGRSVHANDDNIPF